MRRLRISMEVCVRQRCIYAYCEPVKQGRLVETVQEKTT